MSVDMWDQESGSDGTVSNAVRRYTAQWGLPPTYDQLLDRYSSMLERIKALEGELIEVKDLLEIRSNFADAQQREKVKAHVALTQYRVALERCVEALEDRIRLENASGLNVAKSFSDQSEQALALATPLIEKGRK